MNMTQAQIEAAVNHLGLVPYDGGTKGIDRVLESGDTELFYTLPYESEEDIAAVIGFLLRNDTVIARAVEARLGQEEGKTLNDYEAYYNALILANSTLEIEERLAYDNEVGILYNDDISTAHLSLAFDDLEGFFLAFIQVTDEFRD